MPICNLIEYRDNYLKTLWQYYRDEPPLTDAGAIDNFLGSSVSIIVNNWLFVDYN